ncbi:YqgE/AlgH family protein [Halosquirtibacter xylanolyticus]|uniref:YqgE/AlgH family protein n=1 Tax=Halosquirtibacter xylanolyticus TaxID=3374599 RepID=UPI003749DE42|nr:YqgE/AlgH family protein [Prolixibacteraceae bacterium]
MKIFNKDFLEINNSDSFKQGSFMIAEPFMVGRFFSRSVIYIVERTDEGIVGFVLNQLVPYKASALIDGFPDTDCDLFYGGPLDTDRLFYIHTLGDILSGSVQIEEGLYWGGDLEELKSMLSSGYATKDNVRFFLGYSGWSEKQLKDEIEMKNWKVIAPGMISVFPPSIMLWEDTLTQLGEHYSSWKYFPRHPSLN